MPLGIRGLHSWRPQCRVECLKRCCRLRDVKRITASCRNDVMISYKRSCPVGNAILLVLSFFGYQPPIQPSAIFVQPCALPEQFRRLSLFPRIKLHFSYYLVVVSAAQCTRHRASQSEPYRWPIRVKY